MNFQKDLQSILENFGVIKQDDEFREHLLYAIYSNSTLNCGTNPFKKLKHHEALKIELEKFNSLIQKKLLQNLQSKSDLQFDEVLKILKDEIEKNALEPGEIENFQGFLMAHIILEDNSYYQYALEELQEDQEDILKTILIALNEKIFQKKQVNKIFVDEINDQLERIKLQYNTQLFKILYNSLITNQYYPARDFIKQSKFALKNTNALNNFLNKYENKIYGSEILQIPEKKIIETDAPKEKIKKIFKIVEEPIEISPLIPEITILESFPSMSQKIYYLFETFEDSSSEYKMKKIRFYDDQAEEMHKLFDNPQVSIVGMCGNIISCVKFAENLLQYQIPSVQALIIEDKEGILALVNPKINLIVLIYYTQNSLYDFINKAYSNHLAVTYYRYLMDTCENIFIIPSEEFKMNPNEQNPFDETSNPGFNYQEQTIDPPDQVSLIEIPITQDKQILKKNILIIYPEFSRSLILQEIISEINYEPLKATVYDSDFQQQPTYQNQNISSWSQDQEYHQIKTRVISFWSQQHYFFQEDNFPQKFVKKGIAILKQFTTSSSELLETFLNDTLQLYLKQKQITEKKYSDQQDENAIQQHDTLIDDFQEINCEGFQENLVFLEDQIINIEKFKSIPSNKNLTYDWKLTKFFCDQQDFEKNKDRVMDQQRCTFANTSFYNFFIKDCKQLSFQSLKKNFWKYKNIQFDYLEKFLGGKPILFHKNKTSIDFIDQHFKKLEEKIFDYNNKQLQQQKEELILIRKNALEDFFKEIQTIIINQRQIKSQKCNIEFFQINIIRNTQYEVTNWNILQSPYIIHHIFEKGTHDVEIKSVSFIDDTSGFVLFKGTPEKKCSLFYFNCQNKQSSIFQRVFTFSYINTEVYIDPLHKMWISFDNSVQRFNLGKYTQNGKIEDGQMLEYVYNQYRDECLIISIISASFLPNSDSIYLINQNHEIFEIKYQSKQLLLLQKKENKGDTGVFKTKIRPTILTDNYREVQTTYDGKNIILRSSATIDVYDLNLTLVQSISISAKFIYFKSFSDKIYNYLIIASTENIQCFQLLGLTATKQVKTELTGQSLSKSTGNPIIDYFYLAIQKFGPHSDFIGSPSKTTLIFLSQDIEKKKAVNYFESLNLNKFSLESIDLQKIDPVFKRILDQKIPMDILKFLLISRVPIHAATIENFTLVPLQNGKNISDLISQNIFRKDLNKDLIERLIQFISFGVYENYLKSLNHKIYVVSIVGRQSSGKSYVMNRYFGTRFNVASTRCTDGIWISLSEIIDKNNEKKIFLILDCEGLFSARRNEQEEMKLCLALSAVSDIMILNQDLSFNRYLNILFNNFSQAIGRIKGKKLFKGYLLMLIRDVQSAEAEGAYSELMANMTQIRGKKNNFLASLFQGHLKSQCLNYFEQPQFPKEIIETRQRYFQSLKTDRWMNGQDLLESLKITMAQIFIDDDTDMDMHKLNITCEHLYTQCLDYFFNGGDVFKNKAFIYEFQVNESKIIFQIDQKDITFDQNNEQEENKKSEFNYSARQIIQKFHEIFSYETNTHNIFVQNISSILSKCLDQRVEYIMLYFDSKIPIDDNFKEIINNFKFQLSIYLDQFLNKLKYCDKICRTCARQCTKGLNHKENCTCDTTHFCEEICSLSEFCALYKYPCVKVFGHDGDHRCSEGNHKCGNLCDFGAKGCLHFCGLEVNHQITDGHNCLNKHPCNEKCEDEFCTRSCQFDLIRDHIEHTCGEIKCIHRCSLCDNQCIFPNHLHNKLMLAKQPEHLQFTADETQLLLDFHICDKQHECKQQCDQQGVCQIDFTVIEKVWKNSFSEFNYTYFLPKQARLQCKILNTKYLFSHKEPHSCGAGEHRCSEQCVECKSFCNKHIKHDGAHNTNTHRNKENSVFVTSTTKKKIEYTVEGKTRAFEIGESCEPENCSTSCLRKGRSHFHLKECLGGEYCESKINPFVRHSDQIYYPFVDKKYDQVLCQNYWKTLNWDMPIDEHQRELIQSCSFICNISSHGDVLNFCKLPAWHPEIHIFDCKHEGTSDFSKIDIVFCCDTTGSMGSYIAKSKDTVLKILASTEKMKLGTLRTYKFGFVAYRDHPPQDQTYVTDIQELTDETIFINYVNKLTAQGGGDGPEAVLDGLNDAVNKISWRPDSLRYIFHIADAPPHGKQYVSQGDGFPEGCPCGIQIETIAEAIKAKNIRYKLLKIGKNQNFKFQQGTYPNQMAAVFKTKISDYEESDLDGAQLLETQVCEIIVRDLNVEDYDIVVYK